MPEEQEDPGKALKEKSMAEFAERSKGKPTPTQEENDRAAMGEHVVDKEADGSSPDPATPTPKQKQAEAAPGSSAGYQTRQAAPSSRAAASKPSAE